MEHTPIHSQELISHTSLDIVDHGENCEAGKRFEVFVAHYKQGKGRKFRERRPVYKTRDYQDARTFVSGFVMGHREGRSC